MDPSSPPPCILAKFSTADPDSPCVRRDPEAAPPNLTKRRSRRWMTSQRGRRGAGGNRWPPQAGSAQPLPTPQLSATGRIQPTRLPSALLGPLQVCLWNGFCLRMSSQWCNWNKILISHGTNGSTRTYPVSTLWTLTKRRSRRRTASQRGRRGTGGNRWRRQV